jgi:hypothetical protein
VLGRLVTLQRRKLTSNIQSRELARGRLGAGFLSATDLRRGPVVESGQPSQIDDDVANRL